MAQNVGTKSAFTPKKKLKVYCTLNESYISGVGLYLSIKVYIELSMM